MKQVQSDSVTLGSFRGQYIQKYIKTFQKRPKTSKVIACKLSGT
jgi:hypothetical protein